MRLGLVIAALAMVAVGLVQIRRAEIAARHEIQRLETQQISLRRTLWDQQIRLGYLTAPREVRRRAGQMALDLVEPDDCPPNGIAAQR